MPTLYRERFRTSSNEHRPTWEDHRRRQWMAIALLSVLVVWGLTDVRRRARVDADHPTAHKTDFTVYTEAGAAFFDGRDPYAVANPRGWHYLYPPLFAILVAPLAAFDTQAQAVIWYFLSLLACYGIWRECRRLWRLYARSEVNELRIVLPFERSAGNARSMPAAASGVPALPTGLVTSGPPSAPSEAIAGLPPKSIPWLAAATIALPALNCLQRGQVGIVLVYLLLLGVRLIIVRENMASAFVGGAVLALACTIKVTPLLPAGVLAFALLVAAWQKSRNYSTSIATSLGRGPIPCALAMVSGGTAGLMLFVIVLPAMVIGHQQNLSHLQTWVNRVAANDDVGIDNDFNMRSKRNQSLGNAFKRLGNRLAFAAGAGPDDRIVDDLAQGNTAMPMESPIVDRSLRLISAAVVALLLVAAWRTALRADSIEMLALFGLACAATLVVSPISWGHHYVIWLPGLVFVPLAMWRNGRRAAALGLAEAALVLVAAHYIALDHAGRVGLLGIGLTVWYVVGAVAIGWPRNSQFAAHLQDVSTNDLRPPEVRHRRAA